jgi:ribonuclease inhibitor
MSDQAENTPLRRWIVRKIILDLRSVKTQDDVHAYISERFKFPAYYGRNLDAFYDCLTDIGEYTCVGFFELEEENEITPYLQRVKRVLRDAENENRHLAVVFGIPEDNPEEDDKDVEGDVDL